MFGIQRTASLPRRNAVGMGQSTPIEIAGHPYDPETIEVLQTVLDGVWDSLTDLQRNQIPRAVIVERLLRATADGERDPDVLRL